MPPLVACEFCSVNIVLFCSVLLVKFVVGRIFDGVETVTKISLLSLMRGYSGNEMLKCEN